MAQFTYTVAGKDGNATSSTITASDRDAALQALRRQNIRPLSIKESKGKGKFGLSKGKAKTRDIVIFTRELSTMVSAGVPIAKSLATLADQAENKYFQGVLKNVNRDIEGGSQLADALAKYPNVFSEVYINMVRAGEAGGILDDILKRLAIQVEKDATIKKKVKSAMAYPVVILTITVLAFFGIMIFILPKIGKIIKDLGGPNAELPIYSKMLLGVSAFVQHYFIFFIIFFDNLIAYRFAGNLQSF